MSRPPVTILVRSFEPNDAIGNDVMRQRDLLDANVVSGQIPRSLDLDSLLIFHHSTSWAAGEALLAKWRGKIAVRYHNVTPPQFYQGYDQSHYQASLEGVEATRRIAGMRIDRVWGASSYNNLDFIRLGVPADRCRVLPPMHRVEALANAPLDALTLGAHRGDVPNILFVGAFRPHKGHVRALEVFSAYNRPARLIFAGNLNPALKSYVDHIKAEAQRLRILEYVEFAPSVTMAEMRAYYMAASAFLCVSEHEGFCIPLVEAMHFRVPIVAWENTAIGETLGGVGLTTPTFEPAGLAECLRQCVEHPEVSRDLAQRGRLRFEQVFRCDVLDAELLRLVGEIQ